VAVPAPAVATPAPAAPPTVTIYRGTPTGITKQVVPGKPQAQPKPLPRPAAAPPAAAQSASIAPVTTVPRLWEGIYAHGFMWRPRNIELVRQEVVRMLNQRDQMGECLRRLNETMGAGMLADQMVAEFRKNHRTATRQQAGKGRYLLTATLPEPEGGASPRNCVAPPEQLLPFHYLVDMQPRSYANAQQQVAAYTARDRGAGVTWRLPSALEAFAIASVAVRNPDNTQLSFWVDAGGRPEVLSINQEWTRTGERIAFVELTSADVAQKKARLFAVHY
jgi:hypothetical protein